MVLGTLKTELVDLDLSRLDEFDLDLLLTLSLVAGRPLGGVLRILSITLIEFSPEIFVFSRELTPSSSDKPPHAGLFIKHVLCSMFIYVRWYFAFYDGLKQ